MPQTMRVATMGGKTGTGKTGTVPSFPERDNKTGATGQLFKDLSGIVGEERAAELVELSLQSREGGYDEEKKRKLYTDVYTELSKAAATSAPLSGDKGAYMDTAMQKARDDAATISGFDPYQGGGRPTGGGLLDQGAAAGETGRQSSAPPMPTDPKDRKPGMTYTIPDGRRVVWDGKGAKLAR